MKNFLYVTLAVALFSFAACSKIDNQPAFKKIVKSNTIEALAGDKHTHTNIYQYNSDDFLAEENHTIYKKSLNSTDATSESYNYSPNLLTLQFKDKDAKISATLLCHLDKSQLLTVDSTTDHTILYQYDAKNRVEKINATYKKDEKLNYSIAFRYDGDKLLEETHTSINSVYGRTVSVSTFFYEKDILNTISSKYLGKFFNGEESLYVPTEEIKVVTSYSLTTGQLISKAQFETLYSYEVNKNGFITKKGKKEKTIQANWSEEVFTTYEYEK